MGETPDLICPGAINSEGEPTHPIHKDCMATYVHHLWTRDQPPECFFPGCSTDWSSLLPLPKRIYKFLGSEVPVILPAVAGSALVATRALFGYQAASAVGLTAALMNNGLGLMALSLERKSAASLLLQVGIGTYPVLTSLWVGAGGYSMVPSGLAACALGTLFLAKSKKQALFSGISTAVLSCAAVGIEGGGAALKVAVVFSQVCGSILGYLAK